MSSAVNLAMLISFIYSKPIRLSSCSSRVCSFLSWCFDLCFLFISPWNLRLLSHFWFTIRFYSRTYSHLNSTETWTLQHLVTP